MGIEQLPKAAALDHPLREQRLEAVGPHLRRAELKMTAGDAFGAYDAFMDAWMAIVAREFPAPPILTEPLAEVRQLDVRLLNTLDVAEIDTIGDWVLTSDEQRLAIANFGWTGIAAVNAALVHHLLQRCRLLESFMPSTDKE